MEVKTATEERRAQPATLTALLLVRPAAAWPRTPRRRPPPTTSCSPSSGRYGVGTRDARACRAAPGRGIDHSNPVIAVDHDACILCDRCVRACDDIQGNDVIGRTGKGYATRIAFDLNDPMGDSSCVTCGECVAACPTGALTNKPIRDVPIRPRERARPGRQRLPVLRRRLRAHLPRRPRARRDRLRRGPRPARLKGRLCVKGRYGWDYAASPQRLTVPLIRREESYPKGPLSRTCAAEEDAHGGPQAAASPAGLVDYDEVLPHFREATWDEALDLVARRLTRDPRRARPGRDRRLRLGEVLQRGGLPLPEADPDRLPHQQRRPLHPAVPRLQRRRAVRGRSAPARSPPPTAT